MRNFFRLFSLVSYYLVLSTRFDRNVNLFSDLGELTQVSYASKAGYKGGSILCAISSDDNIVMCVPTSSRDRVLLDRRSVDKVSKVDDTLWAGFSGLAGDGRSLIKIARRYCIDCHSKLGSSPTVHGVAQFIGDVQHESTLSGSK